MPNVHVGQEERKLTMPIVKDAKLEKLTTTVQRMLDGNPAIMVGSGCSVPYGLPTMGGLADEIKSKLTPKYGSNLNWQKFIAELDKTSNLETALERVFLDDDIQQELVWSIWKMVYKHDIAAKNSFIRDAGCPAVSKIFAKFIQQAGVTSVVTTNYDRMVEYAISLADGKCCTGFTNGYIQKFSQFESTISKRSINVYKVHGSIDWFKQKESLNLYSLPFFDHDALYDKYVPQIVTPGNSKYRETHLDPFRTVIAKADEALRNACAYLCIGYGFNDEHIQPIILQENRDKKKPIVIVTKEITPKIKELFCNSRAENCLIISENAPGSSIANFTYVDQEVYDANYWQLGEFYKLWFE